MGEPPAYEGIIEDLRVATLLSDDLHGGVDQQLLTLVQHDEGARPDFEVPL